MKHKQRREEIKRLEGQVIIKKIPFTEKEWSQLKTLWGQENAYYEGKMRSDGEGVVMWVLMCIAILIAYIIL